jgi:hypothetical protein
MLYNIILITLNYNRNLIIFNLKNKTHEFH